MKTVGSIIQQYLRETGLEPTVKSYQTLHSWPSIVGEKIARVTEPVRLKNGKLYVRVASDSWRNELLFYREEVIDKLNKAAGSRIVREIVLL